MPPGFSVWLECVPSTLHAAPGVSPPMQRPSFASSPATSCSQVLPEPQSSSKTQAESSSLHLPPQTGHGRVINSPSETVHSGLAEIVIAPVSTSTLPVGATASRWTRQNGTPPPENGIGGLV